LSVYFIFGILLTRALNNRSGLAKNRQITCGIILGIIYASSDELHQSFVPSRSASVVDVLIDAIGLVCGTYSFYTYRAIRQAKTVFAKTHR
jgi:VanZ family protein